MSIQTHEVKTIPIKDIKIDSDNPNSMDEQTFERLGISLERYGNTQPVVVDSKTMLLADGEHRLRAYQKAGMKEIPVILVDFEDDADRRVYRQAANKIRGSHLPERDTAEFEKIIAMGRGADLNLATGLKLTQVEKHMRRYGPSDEELTPAEDGYVVDEKAPAKYEVNMGDVYQLGEHLLMCADMTDKAIKEFAGEVDLVITDPPYNLNFRGTNEVFDEMANDNVKDADYNEFIIKAVKTITSVMKQNTSLYLFIDWRNYAQWYIGIRDAGLDIMNCVVWDKIYAGLGYKYRFRHEFCIYAGQRSYVLWKGDGSTEDVIKISEEIIPKGSTITPVPLDSKGISIALPSGEQFLRLKIEKEVPKRVPVITERPPYNFIASNSKDHDIIERLSMNNFAQINNEDGTGIIHPTMKPIMILADFIKNSSNQGDKVFDPFGGSGSTLIACEQTNRKARIVEISPYYCSIIIQRWEAFTGQKAKKVKQK